MMATAGAAPDQTVRGSITHVIFDMDGLLLDTEKFYGEIQANILARYNRTYDLALQAKMMGRNALEAMLRDKFPMSELMPGASRLIRHLHAKGIPICVATGSHKRHFEPKTQRYLELFSLMHHIVLGDDVEVKRGKPSADTFLVAAKRFEGVQLIHKDPCL